MLRWGLTILMTLAAMGMTGPAALLHSGEWLRLHVVAHDDTPAMQAVKLEVRDAVRETYAAHAPENGGSMLAGAAALLPELTEAARTAARDAGFDGPVTVELGPAAFDGRRLAGQIIPAGTYPALVVRLGEARGHNWWGLLDPEAAIGAAAVGEMDGGDLVWDWSLRSLWEGLFGWMGGWRHAQAV